MDVPNNAKTLTDGELCAANVVCGSGSCVDCPLYRLKRSDCCSDLGQATADRINQLIADRDSLKSEVDRLKDLAQADREGRVVVLDEPRNPLVWGDETHDTVLCPYCGEDLMGIPYGDKLAVNCPYCGEYIDGSKAITHAEAEAALKKEKQQ